MEQIIVVLIVLLYAVSAFTDSRLRYWQRRTIESQDELIATFRESVRLLEAQNLLLRERCGMEPWE